MKSLHIELLGTPKFSHVRAMPQKTKCLLAYLALMPGRGATREKIADLLWPYQKLEQPRHSLRNCLCEMKKVLAPEDRRVDHLMMVDFRSVRFTDAVTVDVDDFSRLVSSREEADLRLASELYRGEFLEGLDIASEPWVEWVTPLRAKFKEDVIRILLRLVKCESLANQHADAIATAQRVIAFDPLCEAGHRNLMRAYTRAGRKAEALRQFDECSRIVRREFGVTPSEKTQNLRQWVLADRRQRDLQTESVESLSLRVRQLEDVIRRLGSAPPPPVGSMEVRL